MSIVASPSDAGSGPSARSPHRLSWTWLGLVPFIVFAVAFLIIPMSYLVVGSFQDTAGNLTVQNYVNLGGEVTINAYLTSIEVSLVTAVLGTVLGFLVAYAVISGGLPSPLRSAVMTFSGVASNFAGIPLALAFVFTIGRAGLLTILLKDILGIDVYGNGFTIYSKLGLEIVYLYFQLPLMILVIAPAIDGLKKEWREAAANMGASSFQFWRHVAFPILLPSLLGATILLFGNAFGAQATAFQLTGGFINVVPILIGRQLSGDVLHDPNLGYALAMGMVAIMAVTLVAYTFVQRRSERWMR